MWAVRAIVRVLLLQIKGQYNYHEKGACMTSYFLLLSIARFPKQYDFLIQKHEKSHLDLCIFLLYF